MSEIEKIFQCRRCGFCCKGETTVSLDAGDRLRMIQCLGLAEEEVYARYLRVTGNCVQMQTIDGHCVFYQDGCRVHAGRPWRCGQWPLHPSILEDELNFHIIADSCPGIRADIGYEEFCRILSSVMASEDKVRC
jgi:Fe-S-cluster containining protein